MRAAGAEPIAAAAAAVTADEANACYLRGGKGGLNAAEHGNVTGRDEGDLRDNTSSQVD